MSRNYSPSARATSCLKLSWGWVRAKLSPDYNKNTDAKFEIETPNALVGVKFSPPDTRVSYDQKKGETVAKGFNNELDVLNKLALVSVLQRRSAQLSAITAAGIIVAAARSVKRESPRCQRVSRLSGGRRNYGVAA